MSFYKRHAPNHREHTRPLPDFQELEGMRALREEKTIPLRQWQEEVRRGKEFGLECVDSIEDKSEISCFQRGELPHWSGINTFLKTPLSRRRAQGRRIRRRVSRRAIRHRDHLPRGHALRAARNPPHFVPLHHLQFRAGRGSARVAQDVRRGRCVLPRQHHQEPRSDLQSRGAHSFAAARCR